MTLKKTKKNKKTISSRMLLLPLWVGPPPTLVHLEVALRLDTKPIGAVASSTLHPTPMVVINRMTEAALLKPLYGK
ncbi:hypothetical protein BDZ91DRAFT_747710 [Kalaharituber pfeilii]|nr:hypothetical protein BDZ91DRAFT_747710 [Kalaharituber pfeilii]